ncbi:N-acetyltransferase [Burkholderia pseudomallei]|uniref:N-acetyltransferase n=1 Tax=Burkholderia pseudomallei TaxID=28450 RepID=UPI001AD7B4EE|nr:N-acetyltransferase [Burkholderia pseudomallei]MBO7776714.1 N-acetyltransferase [Burkholderia pseudomallei]MBO7909602.1 N-acetyltransferase [Burkholderia pseudomallei]
MPLQLRILLDTNILIPLQDSLAVLRPNLAHVIEMCNGRHRLVYHPASVRDIERDRDPERRARTLARLNQYRRLPEGPACPWNNDAGLSPNDQCDNSILYALQRDAAHVLVTEDRGLHAKAFARGLASRVYFIQTIEDLLSRLHEPATVELPDIVEVELSELTDQLGSPFFESLRNGYAPFSRWFREKAREGRQAWIYRHPPANDLSAICIYDVQTDEEITDTNERLQGRALKLCTFKVGERVRGRKIGELFLKMAFRYATANACEHIFIEVRENANPDLGHPELIALLQDFGFYRAGSRNGDGVYVKRHPSAAPVADREAVDRFEYTRQYYPHYRSDQEIRKFIIPIKPRYHTVLFPDHPDNDGQRPRGHGEHVGNAIKLAYLSHTPSKKIRRGDIVLFYRGHDWKAITTLVVVEEFVTLNDPNLIAQLVSRRTVYTDTEIAQMARHPTGVRVMLFRTIEHFDDAVPRNQIPRQVRGNIQTTRQIDDDTFSRILAAAGR